MDNTNSETRGESGPDGTTPADAPPRAGPGWARSLLLVLALTTAYLVNRGGTISSYDTVANEWFPYVLARGEGPFLDRFFRIPLSPWERLPDYAILARGHVVSLYPVGPAFLAVPLVVPQVWYLDRFEPGWDRDRSSAKYHATRMAKNSSAIIAALAALALYHVLYRLGLRRVALPTVLAAALGSDLWVVASQAAWQHGPAALSLTVLIGLLLARPVTRGRLFLGGLAAACLVAMRPIDVVFSAIAGLWLLRDQPRGLPWFLAPAIPIAVALLGYNLHFFQAWVGGQALLESKHLTVHGVEGIWTGDLRAGAAGTLFSPSRGLFIYTPWVALALLTLPATARKIGAYPIVAWLFCGLVLYFAMLAKYAVWWAGHCFGPRYWTDAIPLFAIALGFGLDWARARCRPLLLAFAAAIAWSIAVQAVGAFCYPSTWNLAPANVDRHPARLWDWRDCELTRCLREGRKPW
jgi:hypothetical protein